MVKLELEEVEAFATATFLKPIAPDKTSSANAITARDLYISPPDGKLTRKAVYVRQFLIGTEMLLCV
jgi:hypothetical protein